MREKHQCVGDRRREISKQLTKQIKYDKIRHGESVKRAISSANPRDQWGIMKDVAGLQQNRRTNILFRPDDLNKFYARFEKDVQGESFNVTIQNEPIPATELTEIEGTLRRLKASKASGPDNVPSLLLSVARRTLSPVFKDLFDSCIGASIFPCIWKQSMIKPLPKVKNCTLLKDYRPIVLTSHIGKCFEHVVKNRLIEQVKESMDELQFAYVAGRSTEDAL